MKAEVSRRFGANLKHHRRRAGLSQEEVGFRASLHRTEVGLLERGERCPRIDTAIKLAGAVEADVSQLVDGIEWIPGTVKRGNLSVRSPVPVRSYVKSPDACR